MENKDKLMIGMCGLPARGKVIYNITIKIW